MSDLVAISLFLKSNFQVGDALRRRRIINPNAFIIIHNPDMNLLVACSL